MEKNTENEIKISEPAKNENKIAVVALIVKNPQAVETVNAVLHEYRDYVIGRMGLPYRAKELSVISVVMDAPHSVINAASGKLGNIQGVKSQVLTTK